jgi:hypothetical protein
MGLFSRIKDVATGKIARHNSLIGVHLSRLVKASMEIKNPFVEKWVTTGSVSTIKVLETRDQLSRQCQKSGGTNHNRWFTA